MKKIFLSLAFFLQGQTHFAHATVKEMDQAIESFIAPDKTTYPPIKTPPHVYADWHTGYMFQQFTRHYVLQRALSTATSMGSLLIKKFLNPKNRARPATNQMEFMVWLTGWWITAHFLDQALAPPRNYNIVKAAGRHLTFWTTGPQDMSSPPDLPWGIFDGICHWIIKTGRDLDEGTNSLRQMPPNKKIAMNIWTGENLRFFVRSKTLVFKYTIEGPVIRPAWRFINRHVLKNAFSQKTLDSFIQLIPYDMALNWERILNNRRIDFNVWQAAYQHAAFWEDLPSLNLAIAAPLRAFYHTGKTMFQTVLDIKSASEDLIRMP